MKRVTNLHVKDLLNNLIAKHDIKTWVKYDYDFDFEAGIYRWYGKRIELTPAWEYALYRRVVLGYGSTEFCSMRMKYGKDFLEEIINKNMVRKKTRHKFSV